MYFFFKTLFFIALLGIFEKSLSFELKNFKCNTDKRSECRVFGTPKKLFSRLFVSKFKEPNCLPVHSHSPALWHSSELAGNLTQMAHDDTVG